MNPRRSRCTAGLMFLVITGCGGGPVGPPVPPPPSANCAGVSPIVLSVGGHVVIDPQVSAGCVVLPASVATAEYLVVTVATNGQETNAGISGLYNFSSSATAAATEPFRSEAAQTVPRPLSLPAQFHAGLRAREQALAADPAVRASASAGARAALRASVTPPPVVGSQRNFQVCGNLFCSTFVSVPATAKYVGTKGAIYVDNSLPAALQYTQLDIDDLGRTYDVFHAPINETAFGATSDIDLNQVVVVLLTKAVNDLTPDCSEGRILGFFFGGDLVPGQAGSNAGEVFYALVPSVATPGCSALQRADALILVKGTLIHELQHMISFNQHVLVRSGPSELTWLNEALSHFAEELGGHLIPEIECKSGTVSSCRSLYISGNLLNAYDYLEATESHYLVAPASSTGTLEERGAGWLFLRWLSDQFGTDPLRGTNITQALVNTASVGNINVQNAVGQPFATLVTEWHLANYLDDLSGFNPVSNRLRYVTWGFRSVFALNPTIFALPFPTVPQVITAPGPFTRSGTLRGGSGTTWRVIVPAGSQNFGLRLRRDGQGQALDPLLAARIGVARVQ